VPTDNTTPDARQAAAFGAGAAASGPLPWEDDEPTGPAWEAAKLERNWAAVRIVPERDGTSRKIPVDPDTRKAVGAEVAARLTFAEALALVDLLNAEGRRRHVLGYMPRLGSALVVGDVDAKALEDGAPPFWLLDLHGRLETYVERSPSGKGLRVLFARAKASFTVPEAGGVGLYADAGKALTITLDRLPDSPTEVATAWSRQQAFREQISLIERRAEGAARRCGREDGSEPPRWFDALPETRKPELVEQMLAALPTGGFAERGDGSEPSHWLRVLMAVHHGLGGEGYELIDAWSRDRAGGTYDAADNWRTWCTLGEGNRRGESVTIGSLIDLARAHGWQPPPGATKPPVTTAGEILARYLKQSAGGGR
jgi:hypothetical protein